MPDQPTAGALGVLIVDDEAEIVDLLTLYLGQQGFRVRGATTAEAGLAAMRADPAIGVLITDLRMPDLSGPALAETLFRDRPEAQALEVVLITGAGEGDPALEAFRDKAFAILRKPFRPSAVATAVGRARDAAEERRRAGRAEAGAGGGAGASPPAAEHLRRLAATLHRLRVPLGPLLADAEALAAATTPVGAELHARAMRMRDAARDMMALIEAAEAGLGPAGQVGGD